MAKTNQKQLDLFSQSVSKDNLEHWLRPHLITTRPDAYHWYYRRHVARKPLHLHAGNLNKRHK